LLRDGNSLSVDCFQDRIPAALKQSFADGFSQLKRVCAVAGFAQDLRAVGVGDDCLKVQAAVADFGERADRDLAAAAKFIE
jgi:hypothetical protein